MFAHDRALLLCPDPVVVENGTMPRDDLVSYRQNTTESSKVERKDGDPSQSSPVPSPPLLPPRPADSWVMLHILKSMR